VNPEGIGQQDVDWIHLAHDRDLWRYFVVLQVPRKAMSFLSS
jgi:hypothetical protein